MSFPVHIDLAQYSSRTRWFMAAAWLLIAAKCVAVSWAIDRWHVPLHPAWIVAPTLVFAAVATAIWLTHTRE
ncbi:MAG TPA: hypothetical protein VHD62_14365 [Opitutaceae bacterium]|nr:hypothetical protein [Opitutaceae bacterium]